MGKLVKEVDDYEIRMFDVVYLFTPVISHKMISVFSWALLYFMCYHVHHEFTT